VIRKQSNVAILIIVST